MLNPVGCSVNCVDLAILKFMRAERYRWRCNESLRPLLQPIFREVLLRF